MPYKTLMFVKKNNNCESLTLENYRKLLQSKNKEPESNNLVIKNRSYSICMNFHSHNYTVTINCIQLTF